MSRRAIILALLAFVGTVGGYWLSKGYRFWPQAGMTAPTDFRR